MTHRVLGRVLLTMVAISLSLCSLQGLAQQNLVAIQKFPSALGLQLGSRVAMPTANAQGGTALGSPFSHRGVGSSGLPRGPRYPGDLQYHGGPVLATTIHHTIYLNPSSTCPVVTCWGNPITFLNDLSNSGMIHVTDQYVGTTANNRYPVGTNFLASGYTPIFGGTTFTDLDIEIIADAAAQLESTLGSGSGYGLNHVYHVFLVPGQDLCFDTTYSACYSPDVPSSFVFCAYHGYGVDSANGTFLYSAEPYQDVNGCAVEPGTPNGEVTDSTNNVLSHESFETITDPLISAWYNTADVGVFGEEIGDECEFVAYSPAGAVTGFGPNYVKLNGNPYAIQPEYTNSMHACATSNSE